MKNISLGLCVCLLGFAAAAAPIEVDTPGGVGCPRSEQIDAMITQGLRGQKSPLPGCFELAPGVVINSISHLDHNGLTVGQGTASGLNADDPFHFVAATRVTLTVPQPLKFDPDKAAPASPPAPRTYKVVSPADVRATPEKWMGRDIEFRNVRVYWVEDDDVRLLTGDMVTVFATSVEGKAADLDFFRRNCETLSEAESPRCRASLRFSYHRHATDRPSGWLTRTVLVTFDAELARPARR